MKYSSILHKFLSGGRIAKAVRSTRTIHNIQKNSELKYIKGMSLYINVLKLLLFIRDAMHF